jgi:OmpA-OmpF porin, OOP family
MKMLLSLVLMVSLVTACNNVPAESTETESASSQTLVIEKPIADNAYLIYFDWDKAVLNDEGMQKLRKVVKKLLLRKDPYLLNLNGHADASGAADYNMTLSEKRANRVKTLLSSFGVPAKTMSVYAFGESDLAVPTKDGVREPLNRRVEIFVE